MRIFALLGGMFVIGLALVDAFETILQPRRVTHRFRYSAVYYRFSWRVVRFVALGLRVRRWRESFLSVYGPVSLLGLFATWIVGLILGFALVNWGAGLGQAGDATGTIGDYLYMSGTTFFTLGYGDVTPRNGWGRVLAVVESGLGFAFLAVVIGYLPVLYTAFSERERVISLMDARAGSPSSASEVLLRFARAGRMDKVSELLAEWEKWAAGLLESHLSFPVLSYYRSQHDNQSWVAALATILDTSAILMTEVEGADLYQARVTFAMARHAAVDLGLVLRARPRKVMIERLLPGDLSRLRERLKDAGVKLREDSEGKLLELRAMYEPFLEALARQFLFALPAVVTEGEVVDNWQRSSLGRAPGLGVLGEEHF